MHCVCVQCVCVQCWCCVLCVQCVCDTCSMCLQCFVCNALFAMLCLQCFVCNAFVCNALFAMLLFAMLCLQCFVLQCFVLQCFVCNALCAICQVLEHSQVDHVVFVFCLLLCCVCVAGASKTKPSGLVLREARYINTSLSCLGTVISKLGLKSSVLERRRNNKNVKIHIPWRDW